MSVQAWSWVLEHSPRKDRERLALLAIANFAPPTPHDGAWEAWPSVATIGKLMQVESRRSVQTVLARLERQGAIERVVNGAPLPHVRPDRRPNLWRVLLAHGVRCLGCGQCATQPVDNPVDDVVDNGSTGRNGAQDRAQRGAGSCALSVIDPLQIDDADELASRARTRDERATLTGHVHDLRAALRRQA